MLAISTSRLHESAAARRSGTRVAPGPGTAPWWPRAARWTGTVIIAAWAVFWTWFAGSVAVSEGGRSWLFGGGLIAVSLAIAAVTIFRPRVGGVLAIGAGLFSLWFFAGAWALLLLATPPIVGGVLASLGGWNRGKRG